MDSSFLYLQYSLQDDVMPSGETQDEFSEMSLAQK